MCHSAPRLFECAASWKHTQKSTKWQKIKSSTQCHPWARALSMQQKLSDVSHTQILSGAAHDVQPSPLPAPNAPLFNNSPWIRFHSWLNLFTRVERLSFFFPHSSCRRQRGCAWCGLILPAALARASTLISSCLMRDIDGPRPTCSELAKVLLGSPAALADVDEIYFYKKRRRWKRQMMGNDAPPAETVTGWTLTRFMSPVSSYFPSPFCPPCCVGLSLPRQAYTRFF